MNPLTCNDCPGVPPSTWYHVHLPEVTRRPSLKGAIRVDVAVIGAGYTGLWAAKHLAEAGLNVAVLDAHGVGFGGSGRNGGQLHPGFTRAQIEIEARRGPGDARALWDLSRTGMEAVKAFCAKHPETAYRAGIAHATHRAGDMGDLARDAEYLAKTYGYEIELLDRAAFGALVQSPLYAGGTLDPHGGHLNPLAYARALAGAAEAAGARIYEDSEVTAITPPQGAEPVRLTTPLGRVEAESLIIAGNGYFPSLYEPVHARVMPINSIMLATEPLGDRWREVLTRDIAVSDAMFIVNYFRLSEDHRLLFGGRENFRLRFPKAILPLLRARMLRVFPQLSDVAPPHVWGGTLGITPSRIPLIGRCGNRILVGAGFSGQGLSLTAMAGRVLADAIRGQHAGLSSLEKLPVPRFPGGDRLRAPILSLAMAWYALRDRIGV